MTVVSSSTPFRCCSNQKLASFTCRTNKTISDILLPEKPSDISRCHHSFPCELTCEKREQKFLPDCPDLNSAPESKFSTNQKHFPCLEFLHSSLRRHFAGKPIVASRNVGYRKIPNISPGAYIFQRPFLRGLFL